MNRILKIFLFCILSVNCVGYATCKDRPEIDRSKVRLNYVLRKYNHSRSSRNSLDHRRYQKRKMDYALQYKVNRHPVGTRKIKVGKHYIYYRPYKVGNNKPKIQPTYLKVNKR